MFFTVKSWDTHSEEAFIFARAHTHGSARAGVQWAAAAWTRHVWDGCACSDSALAYEGM